jgi:hypothetical protein
MALRQKLDELIEGLKGGDILATFDRFYGENVSMGENADPPTVGKAANRVREEQFLASVKEWKSLNISASAAEGEGDSGVAFIEYDFEFVNTDDQTVKYEQITRQTWKDGVIVDERFYHG